MAELAQFRTEVQAQGLFLQVITRDPAQFLRAAVKS